MVVDDYGTHNHARFWAWLESRPRYYMNFTPTSSSCMNMVERLFRSLTVDVVLLGSSTTVKEMAYAITNYLAGRNLSDTRHERRTDKAETLAKIMRAHEQA